MSSLGILLCQNGLQILFFSLGLLFLSLSLFAFFDCSFLFFRRFLDSGLWRQAFTKPLFPDAWQVTGRRSYNVSGTPDKFLDEESYNVSGTPDKLLDEDLTTYQERLTSYWTKILQRIRNAWQVSGRRSYKVAGIPDKLLDEDLTTYQERLTSYWTKILQRIRNAWQVSGRRSYNVSGTPDKLLDEDVRTKMWQRIKTSRLTGTPQATGRYYTPPTPPPPPKPPPKNLLLKNDKILVRFSTRRLKHAMPVMTALPCSSLVCLSIECHKEEQRDKGSKKVQGIRPNI